jgi:hypothetical protein
MTNEKIPVAVTGRCIISDDLGNVILDKTNAIHSKNMSRVFARALSNESNFFINRIAFGNGGTTTDASHNVNYNRPRDGNRPYDSSGYKSRLYNETYYELINENGGLVGSGPGSSRANDPMSEPNNISGPGVVSVESGTSSQVHINCVLNRYEPSGEYISSTANNTETADGSFAFDEIGLFTGGVIDDVATNGFQTATISTPNLFVASGVALGKTYKIPIEVNGLLQEYKFSPRATSSIAKDNYLKFTDLIEQLNEACADVVFSMTNGSSSNAYYGYLKVTSKTNGVNSSVRILAFDPSDTDWLFNNIPLFVGLNDSVQGQAAGVQNNPNDPARELSRMLTHLIFDPITKPADRVYIIEYIININVPATVK